MKIEILALIVDGYEEAIHLRKIAQGWEKEVLTKPEYLFTVKIFESLAIKLNENSGVNTRYYIRLEEPTHEIARFSYKPILFNRSITKYGLSATLQTPFRPSREGKVDIAIYRPPKCQEGERLEFVIEVKDFNPQAIEIRNDIERIIELIENKQKTSESSFQFGVVTYLVSKNKEAVARKEQNTEKIKKLAMSYVPDAYKSHTEVECRVLEEWIMPEYSLEYEENNIDIDPDEYFRYYHVSIVVNNPNPIDIHNDHP